MIQSIHEYQAEQIRIANSDYLGLSDLKYILSRFRDSMQISLVEHCSEKEKQSRQDLMLSQNISLDEYDVLTRKPQSALEKMNPLDYYRKDMRKLKAILNATNSSHLHSDRYKKTISGFFTTALNKLKKKDDSDAELISFLFLFAGDSHFISDRCEIVHEAYSKALEYLIVAPKDYVWDYCNVILKIIKRFSAKLAEDEFYMIYMDLVNRTAADYLGTEIVDIINTYTVYSNMTDKKTMYDKYLATSIDN